MSVFEVIKEKCDVFNEIINNGDFSEQMSVLCGIIDELFQLLPQITVFPINQNRDFPDSLFKFIIKCEPKEVLEKCYIMLNNSILKNTDACDILVAGGFHLFVFDQCTEDLNPLSGILYETLAILCENNIVAQNSTSHCTIFDYITDHYKETGFPHIQALRLINSCGEKFSYSQCIYLFPYLNESYEKEGLEIPTIKVMTTLVSNCKSLYETFERFGIIKKFISYLLEGPINNNELAAAVLEFLVTCYITKGDKQMCSLFTSEAKLYENLANVFMGLENKNSFIKSLFDVCFVNKSISKMIHDSPLQEELKKCIYESCDWRTEKFATLIVLNEFFNNTDEYRDISMDSCVFDSMISILQSSDTNEKMFILDNICAILRNGFDANGTMFTEEEFVDEIMELEDCGILTVQLTAKTIEDFFCYTLNKI